MNNKSGFITRLGKFIEVDDHSHEDYIYDNPNIDVSAWLKVCAVSKNIFQCDSRYDRVTSKQRDTLFDWTQQNNAAKEFRRFIRWCDNELGKYR